MHLLSNSCLRWATALNLVFVLFATGCKEGSNAKVENGSGSAQSERKANEGATSEATAVITIDEDSAGEVPVPRVAAGDIAPDFELPSSTGGIVTLSTLLRESAVALVFYRSAVW